MNKQTWNICVKGKGKFVILSSGLQVSSLFLCMSICISIVVLDSKFNNSLTRQ